MYRINFKIIHQIVLYKNIRKYKITNEIMLFYIFFLFFIRNYPNGCFYNEQFMINNFHD